MEALEIAQRHEGSIDVVVTDVVMPRGSGREIAEQILKIHPEASVIFMTGYTDDAVLLRGVFAQEVRLLRKPFPQEELIATVGRGAWLAPRLSVCSTNSTPSNGDREHAAGLSQAL
jgi:CheY-like chemotaxis protein